MFAEHQQLDLVHVIVWVWVFLVLSNSRAKKRLKIKVLSSEKKTGLCIVTTDLGVQVSNWFKHSNESKEQVID